MDHGSGLLSSFTCQIRTLLEGVGLRMAELASGIGDPKNPKIKIVLSEFKGIVVEVFEVDNWFRVFVENGKS